MTTANLDEIKYISQSTLSGMSNTDDSDVTFVEFPIVSYVITEYVSGTSGYRIWSNGYCEQWGRKAKGSALAKTSGWTGSVALLKTYANTNYDIITGINNGTTTASNKGDEIGTGGMTTSSFGFAVYNRSSTATDTTIELAWMTRGYLASGQY